MTKHARGRIDRDIRNLPLADLSLRFGTAGLEARLDATLDERSLGNNELIQWTRTYGLMVHKNDRRSGEPYNDHLLRSTIRIMEELDVSDPEVIAAMPLHDSVEDHPNEVARLATKENLPDDPYLVRKLAHEALKLHTTPTVANIVLDISNPLLAPGEDKYESYKRHMLWLAFRAPPEDEIAKLGDALDNFEATPLENSNKRRRLDQKHIGLGIYAIHIAGLDRFDDDTMNKNTRDRTRNMLERRQSQALGRLGIDPDIFSSTDSLRSA